MALPEGARCLAILDVIFEAFLVFVLFDGFSIYCLMAPSQRIEVADQFEQEIHGLYVTVRSEVGSEMLVYLPCLEDAGQVFIGDDDAGIGFPVLQQYVVPWRPLLDEVVLQQKGILFGLDNDVFYVANL